MQYSDLDPIAREVLDAYKHFSFIRIEKNKVVRLPLPARQEQNLMSIEFINMQFPGKDKAIHRAFAQRFTTKCQKYAQLSTLHNLFLQSRKLIEQAGVKHSLAGTSQPLHIEEKGGTGGSRNATQTSIPMCDIRLPEDFRITFTGEQRIHRIEFFSKKHFGTLKPEGTAFQKIKERIHDFKDKNLTNWLKLDNFTVGLSSNGKLQFFIKCDPNGAKDFFCSEFSFLNYLEATEFLKCLDPTPRIEVGMPYTGDLDLLRKSKIKVTLPGSPGSPEEIVWLWEDGSLTSREVDVSGNGPTAYNLATLISDRLGTIQFMKDVRGTFSKIYNLLRFLVQLILEGESANSVDSVQHDPSGRSGRLDDSGQMDSENDAE